MSRRPIQQLSQALINRIAAGEVIERPASVVKELVENALDAGASNIIIDIEDGGRALIRVTDNGGGIPAEELPLAFASHATSKLRDDADLVRIATMGFRGEALASIGSVSQARLVSRTPGQTHAFEISQNGDEAGEVLAAAANVGTSVEIRNLFFNTPARRKFLKGTVTEFGHVSQTVLRLALPFEQVSFTLTHNGRTTLTLPVATRPQRLLEAWPDEFRGSELVINADFSEVHIEGIIGLPELARPTQGHQYLYINGRAIRDKFIGHALREAYRGLTEPGRHPAAVLLISMPPDEVDVNVHPTKSEVRFRDGTRIHGIIHSAARQKLLGSDLAPVAVPVNTFSEALDNQRQGLREKLAEFFQQYPAAPTTAADGTPLAPLPKSVEMPPMPEFSSDRQRALPGAAMQQKMPAIQLHNSYLVAQSDDGLIIIDQHALHERIIYEELLARMSRGNLESQPLLIPQTLSASARQIDLLEQIRPMLAKLGMDVQAIGPDAVAIHAFPSFLHRLDPERFVAELLERGEQELLDLNQEELLHEVLDMMSCKAAVKAGDPLTSCEIEALLARRQLVDRSSNCPHGRPTTLRLSLSDLEKQFKRTGF